MAKVSYGAAAEEVIELFHDYFSGSSSYPFLTICSSDLGEAASEALEKSLSALGYQSPAFSIITISPAGSSIALDASALRLLTEGIDPYRIICADEEALSVLSEAYGMTLIPNAINRIGGRSSGVFAHLNEMVQDPKKKYLVWEILKALK